MSNIDAELQKQILTKLMFKESIKYAELEKVTENHDLFNYHLRELVKKGFIEKTGSSYSLTAKGRQQVAFFEEDGTVQKQFKVGMFIDLLRKVDDHYEMMLYKRLKHPHYGYIGAITGKLKWGDSLEENLKRELMEEVGVTPTKFKILGVVRDIFSDENHEKVGDGVFFDIAVEEWEGTPSDKSVEGDYFWCDIDKILDLENIFRTGFEQGLPLLKQYLHDRENFSQYVIENGTDGLKY